MDAFWCLFYARKNLPLPLPPSLSSFFFFYEYDNFLLTAKNWMCKYDDNNAYRWREIFSSTKRPTGTFWGPVWARA
jgi:hypothetical protein